MDTAERDKRRPTKGQPLSERVRGTTMRWTWSEGPTKGSTHEHVFNDNGSVIWTCIAGAGKGHSAHEKRYAAYTVGEDVDLVSYRSSTGFTITAALNFRDHSLVGFASNTREWHPCRGTFEVVR